LITGAGTGTLFNGRGAKQADSDSEKKQITINNTRFFVTAFFEFFMLAPF